MELKRSDLAESPDQHVCRIYANGLAARPSCQEGLCGLAQFQLHSSPDFHQRVSQLAHHYFILGGSRREAQALSPARNGGEIGRASCRERVCQYVEIRVVAVALKTKHKIETN